MTANKTNTKKERLLALDVMRGITIAGMILVNNPGSWGKIFTPLEHASWNGLTPTDLVFPFFMFIMGISTYFSLRKYDFKFSWDSCFKIFRRAIVILLIGWGIAWFSRLLWRLRSPEEYTVFKAIINFDSMRTLGVLPRLAICYFATAILALLFKEKTLKWIIGSSLVVYAIILLCGHGFEFSERNIIGVVDRAVLGEGHMYTDQVGDVRLIFDPEGLLSTLPSIAHCLIGFLCGGMIVKTKDIETKTMNLMLIGGALTFCGFLLSYGLPLNKKIWSPSFVLTTCGLASMLLGMLIYVIDIKGKKKWCTFFEVFGINPLFLYALSSVLAILFGYIRMPFAGSETGVASLKVVLYQGVFTPFADTVYHICHMPASCDPALFASVLFAIFFVLINWCVGLPLYKKKIYIKI